MNVLVKTKPKESSWRHSNFQVRFLIIEDFNKGIGSEEAGFIVPPEYLFFPRRWKVSNSGC
jgi:hypothetical protein